MGMVTHAIVTDGPANSGAKRKYPLADYMQRAEERQLSVRIRPMSQAIASMCEEVSRLRSIMLEEYHGTRSQMPEVSWVCRQVTVSTGP